MIQTDRTSKGTKRCQARFANLGELGSQLRNPRIAAALYDTRMAETMEQAGLAPPLFESDRGNDQFVARYFFHHFLGAEDIAWLARFKDLQLTEDEAKALIVVREAGAIDNATYRELSRLDALTASQALRRLRDAGLLAQKGRGSATYYIPTERLVDKGLSSNSEALSRESEGLSMELDAARQAARNALLATVPGELAARMGALGRRSPPDRVRAVVLDLLRQREWRLEELSQLLQRNAEYVRQQYLQPHVKGGTAAMTREPNDPQQAYRAVEGRG